MPETPRKDLRPYELHGGEYALWYEVGEKLGMMAQLAVEGILCHGHEKLEYCFGRATRELDERTRKCIEAMAFSRQVRLYNRAT